MLNKFNLHFLADSAARQKAEACKKQRGYKRMGMRMWLPWAPVATCAENWCGRRTDAYVGTTLKKNLLLGALGAF